MSLIDQIRELDVPDETQKGGTGEKESVRIVETDGYVRRSPVQDIYVPPEYSRKKTVRIVLAVLAVIIIAAALAALADLGYITV